MKRIAINTGGGDAPRLSKRDVMVALNPPRIDYVPLADAIARTRLVPPDGDGVLTARTFGIAFGD